MLFKSGGDSNDFVFYFEFYFYVFYWALLSQEGDDKLFQFYLLSNHSLAPFLDLLTTEYTKDTKVDHVPVIHTY